MSPDAAGGDASARRARSRKNRELAPTAQQRERGHWAHGAGAQGAPAPVESIGTLGKAHAEQGVVKRDVLGQVDLLLADWRILRLHLKLPEAEKVVLQRAQGRRQAGGR